jgi:urease accessory protein
MKGCNFMASGLVKSSLAAAIALMPAVAFAHTGIGNTNGFLHGFGHPLSGLDHILAMLMVGIFAWQLGGRALWLVPITFVGIMAIGGTLGIALSVVVLGAVVAFNVKAPVAAAMGMVGLFAIFHGHAHGAEISADASGVAYAAGFLIATALLHLAGISAGFLIAKTGQHYGSMVMRLTGGLTTVAGVALLVSNL